MSEKTKVVLVLDEDRIPRLGSSSITGLMVSHCLSEGIDPASVGELELAFPQTSPEWRRANKGPLEYIIPEYVVPCMMEDILYLMGEGIKVTIRMTEKGLS